MAAWTPRQVRTRDEPGASLDPPAAAVWLTLHGRYSDGARHLLRGDNGTFGRCV